MKFRIAAAAAAIGLLAAGVANAQETQVDDECRNQAEEAGLATTHNVTYDRDRNVCVAVPIFGGGILPVAPAGLATTPAIAAGVGLTLVGVLAALDSSVTTDGAGRNGNGNGENGMIPNGKVPLK